MTEIPETQLQPAMEQRVYFRFPVEGEALVSLDRTNGGLDCTIMELGLKRLPGAHNAHLEGNAAELKGTLPIVEAAPRAEAGDAEKDSAAPPIARKREQRQHQRYKVDGKARIRFLSMHTLYRGKVVDLSMSGCRVRFEEIVPLGVFRRRVEVDLVVNGMAMLMSGVTQVIHDRYEVGIRFVEVTEHKMEHLRIVITEVEHRMGLQSSLGA